MDTEIIVIGAGLVGSAIAYGLLRAGARVLVLDGSDRDFRAARANFGLIWVQGKGQTLPPYAAFTRDSSDLWPDFHDELSRIAETRIDYSRPGGLSFCIGPEAFDRRRDVLTRMHNLGIEADTEMVERDVLQRMLPRLRLGPDVTGASFCARDGHVNPLQLLAALHCAISRLGGRIAWRSSVRAIGPEPGGGFRVASAAESWNAPRVVVAAGVNSATLLAQIGFALPLRAERGQILVTERLAPALPYPANGLRQTAEGTMMVGATHEEVGLDPGVTRASGTELARGAVRTVPALAGARLVRQWSGLRVLSPDGGPVYAEAPDHRGLYATYCHSAVTLAAAHVGILAPALAAGSLPEAVSSFNHGRFDVPKCA